MISYATHEVISHVPTPEGSQIVEQGSNEARVWAALPLKGQGDPVTPNQLKKVVGDEVAKVGQGRAFKNGWIAKDGDGLVKLVNSDIQRLLAFTNIYTGPRNQRCHER